MVIDDTDIAAQCFHRRVDGAVTNAVDRSGFAILHKLDLDFRGALVTMTVGGDIRLCETVSIATL